MKVSDFIVLLGFFAIALTLYFAITQNISDKINLEKKCKENNMILVEPFREKPYCVKGIR